MAAKKTKAERVGEWCLAQRAATVDNTFGEQTNVYRVANKMFALVNEAMATLKVVPEEGEALRAKYEFVTPGYYMNKRHWVSVDLTANVPMGELQELVAESYRLVFDALPKKVRAEIGP